MKDVIKQALTRRTNQNAATTEETQPSERLVLGVKFAIAMTLCLSAMEIAHMALLNKWNSEIFAAITGSTGTLTGIFITQKT